MPNKLLVATLAAAIATVTAIEAPATTKKKKPVKPETQTEESADEDAMNDMALDIATGLLGGAMKKGKMPKGGKELLKHGIKAAKDSAKKSKDGAEKDPAKKKDPLKMLFGSSDD
jgi:hypothetical protein